jgi:hypothetical protein
MSKNTQRYCKLCGTPLSFYNKDKVCFYHTEHKDYKYKGQPNTGRKIGVKGIGHSNAQNISDLQYYGQCK